MTCLSIFFPHLLEWKICWGNAPAVSSGYTVVSSIVFHCSGQAAGVRAVDFCYFADYKTKTWRDWFPCSQREFTDKI